MKPNRFSRILLFLPIVIIVAGASLLPAQPKEQQKTVVSISREEYGQRRTLLISKMEPNSIAVFKAKDPSNRSNDVNYDYRQESNFLYLTGCDESRSYLLLAPDGVQVDSVTTAKEVFFIQPRQNSATGESLGSEGAKAQLGFQAVLPSSELRSFVKRVLTGKRILYYDPSLPDLVRDPLMEKAFVISRETKNELRAAFSDLEIKTLLGPMAGMREVKSPAEIALLQKAIDITVAAQIEAMKSCEPEMYEYELQAVIEYCFTKQGAEYQGFPSIVGSGPYSCIVHYEANRRQMKSGDVVVMDIGAEHQDYTADITRTIPVNGKFTPAQRAIYEIVLEAQEEAIKQLKPGISSGAASQKATEVVADGLVKLGVIKDKSEVQRYYPHGISHNIGLDVHDAGRLGALLAPGMIITIEPGIYIPEQSPCDKMYWNIGVRIEDDVLITESGTRIVSAEVPKAISEIEELMKKRGIGNVNVGTK